MGKKYKIDLIGNVFGMLTVISEDGRNKHGGILWVCRCECGNEKVICGDNLKAGTTKSCGCLNRQQTSSRNLVHGGSVRSKILPEYTVWTNLISRCTSLNDNRYKQYGGRGISVCDRWRNSFEYFLKDMGTRPTQKHSIERDNVDGNYEPSNCRWATSTEQARNKTNNHWIEFEGRRMILKDWAIELKAGHGNISKMLKSRSFSDVVDYYRNHRRKPRTIQVK